MIRRRLQVHRLPDTFVPDQRRVIHRFFAPGGDHRVRALIDRVIPLTETGVRSLLKEVVEPFGSRHKDITTIFGEHFERIAHLAFNAPAPTLERRLLIGATTLFNPSIVEAPDQDGLPQGATRAGCC